jgi:D-alanyl-D-alanine carboxypeptidase/D-alanyl-D-alanine-endopeptidase (penicillin-binding protein 4)
MSRPGVLVMVVTALLLANCSGPFVRQGLSPTPLTGLREQLAELFADRNFSNAFWGVLVQSAETGEIVFGLNEDKSFVPASNMKLFTTAVALLKLGPGFRYHTEVYGLGEVDEEGILQGSLVVRGSGDPTISGRFNDGEITASFQAWAESLISRGVRSVAGDIIGDDDVFDDQLLGQGWAWDYQTDWYAAQISGLSFNDNCVDISIMPGEREGQPARVEIDPATAYVDLRDALVTCGHPWEEDWKIHRRQGTNVVDVTGCVALGDEVYKGWFTVHNPTLFTTTVFKEVLISHGLLVTGQAKDIDQVDKESMADYEDIWPSLADHTSPSLTEIIRVVNKRSQNFYAEQLLKTLGAVFRGEGSFSSGIQVVEETLSEMGISPSQFVMVDGSGLSRHNFVTPKQVVTLLSHMARHKDFDCFRDSLPIAGVDGTIDMRMCHTAAERKVWAKTGYVDRVRALSGYAFSLDGEMFIFSMMVNNYTVPTSLAEDVQDRACQLLASFSRRGSFFQKRES